MTLANLASQAASRALGPRAVEPNRPGTPALARSAAAARGMDRRGHSRRPSARAVLRTRATDEAMREALGEQAKRARDYVAPPGRRRGSAAADLAVARARAA